MSVGGPGLGTLLVQRIDAALGTTLSQQTNLTSGARPDAVSQAAEAARVEQIQNQLIRAPRESVDRAQLQNEQQIRQSIERGKLDAQKGLLSTPREGPNTGTTQSAPTTLGNTARTILALLMNYPEQPAPVQGRQPLVSPFQDGARTPSGQAGSQATNAGAASTTSTAQSKPAAGTTGPTPNAQPGAASTQPASAVTMALASQRVSTQAFSQALSSALQNSGLFYESHLSSVAFAKMPAQALRSEPQAQLTHPSQSAANPGSGAASTSSSNAAAQNNATTATLAGNAGRGESLQGSANQTTPVSQSTTNQPSPSTALSSLHPETHLLVRQQLEVLANQTLAWRGEAWPDAHMDWEIQKRDPNPSQSGEDQTHWATRLKLHLPHLGEVDVRLNLVGQQVLMHLVAPDAADTLSANSDALRASFNASGLQLNQFVIDKENSKADIDD